MMMQGMAARAGALQGSLRLRAAGASAKGGSSKTAKKSRSADGPAAPVVPKELREKAVLGANILKDGSDPSILADRREKRVTEKLQLLSDALGLPLPLLSANLEFISPSEYPQWLFGVLDKRPPLSELQRKKQETMPDNEIIRLLKLDNRRRIKENNAVKAKK